MNSRQKLRRILWYESIGFVLIIILSWLDEVLNLPGLLFGGAKQTDWRESVMETVVIMAVWLIVLVFTGRLLGRLQYLEGFLRICAWCRKVYHNGEWIPVETFFDRKLDVKTTHGMCPECARKLLDETGQTGRRPAGSGGTGAAFT
jgi:hypothetical protein